MIRTRITPNLWFDGQAEQAATFYAGIFRNSRIIHVSRYGKAGFEVHRQPEGQAMAVVFELDGQKFVGINGGQLYKFTEAVSFAVECETQAEIDHFWDSLSEGGDPSAQQCGWLKDKFGLSWQVVPARMGELMSGGPRVMEAMLKMKKIDIAALERAGSAG